MWAKHMITESKTILFHGRVTICFKKNYHCCRCLRNSLFRTNPKDKLVHSRCQHTTRISDPIQLTNGEIQKRIKFENEQIKKLRKWVTTPAGDYLASKFATDTNGVVFKLICYNVMAQDLVKKYPDLHKDSHPLTLEWSRRWKNIFKEIHDLNAEIICLQEVQASHLKKCYSIFNKIGYGSIYKKRTGARKDGCATYYRKDLFDLKELITIEYSMPGVSVLESENVGLIARLSLKKNPDVQLVVANTHLIFWPRRTDMRIAQTQIMLAEIDRMAYKRTVYGNIPEYFPIILTGDFNSEPLSPVPRLITNGKLQYENLTHQSMMQVESKKSNTEFTGKMLLPPALRITDNCQHFDIMELRKFGVQLPRNEEEKLIQTKTNNNTFELQKVLPKNMNLFSSGCLSHDLNLKSAYSLDMGSDSTGTTYRNVWTTVDYIFYNGTENKNVKSKLKLLEKYSLPRQSQMQEIKNIPNFVLGSDHIALAAKFKIDF